MQQLDIFLDSEPVQRANDLIVALSLFDRAASKQALHHLKIVDPNHADLPRFQVLCDFLDQGLKSSNQPDIAAREAAVIADEKSIREQIIPAAAVMGHKRGALIHKYWHTLALTSEKWGIPPERQALFSAELYWRAQQYSELVRTAQTVSGGLMRAAVQRWLGLGLYGCGAVKQGRQAVFRYAWLAPQKFDGLVDEIADLELSRDWNNFQNDLDQLDASWFPAWCANDKKNFLCAPENLPAGEGCSAYRLLMGLNIREHGGICPVVYEDRQHLKQLNETFFKFYMTYRQDALARKS